MSKNNSSKKGKPPYIIVGVVFGLIIGMLLKNIGLWLVLGLTIGAGLDSIQSKE